MIAFVAPLDKAFKSLTNVLSFVACLIQIAYKRLILRGLPNLNRLQTSYPSWLA